jgi:hypothetical protein
MFTPVGVAVRARGIDFASMVRNGVWKGSDVDIITGVHGFADGSTAPDLSMFANDVAAFGDLPGVTVHNFPDLLPSEINSILNGDGTIIGGFCNSGACLGPLK